MSSPLHFNPRSHTATYQHTPTSVFHSQHGGVTLSCSGPCQTSWTPPPQHLIQTDLFWSHPTKVCAANIHQATFHIYHLAKLNSAVLWATVFFFCAICRGWLHSLYFALWAVTDIPIFTDGACTESEALGCYIAIFFYEGHSPSVIGSMAFLCLRTTAEFLALWLPCCIRNIPGPTWGSCAVQRLFYNLVHELILGWKEHVRLWHTWLYVGAHIFFVVCSF